MSRFARRLLQVVPTFLPAVGLSHGQQITTANTGRAGATNEPNYSATLTTLSGSQAYSTTQTIRNTRFTGPVEVTGGTVTFEFCSFEYQPLSAGCQLRQYNNGASAGTMNCNWCDFDTGLRGTQGTFESTCLQFGERGGSNPKTTGGVSNVYRCRMQGAGNLLGAHKWEASSLLVRECFIADCTSGGGSHPDGIEIYSSDNFTLERCRVQIDTATGQSCINITNDFNDTTNDNPIIIKDCYINGGTSPVLTRPQGGTDIKNVRYTNNYFGDDSYWGRECDFNSMNVTYNYAYHLANPSVIYWAPSNVWAPDGESVGNPSLSPSGDTSAGRPHTPGEFIDSRNFYGGEMWIWNGSVVGPAGP